MFIRHDSIQELPGAPQHASFPTAPLRVACLPEYFMYYNYLKRLGTRQGICISLNLSLSYTGTEGSKFWTSISNITAHEQTIFKKTDSGIVNILWIYCEYIIFLSYVSSHNKQHLQTIINTFKLLILIFFIIVWSL
jgi:hypothetical protein